jgi:hypothetical protein
MIDTSISVIAIDSTCLHVPDFSVMIFHIIKSRYPTMPCDFRLILSRSVNSQVVAR